MIPIRKIASYCDYLHFLCELSKKICLFIYLFIWEAKTFSNMFLLKPFKRHKVYALFIIPAIKYVGVTEINLMKNLNCIFFLIYNHKFLITDREEKNSFHF